MTAISVQDKEGKSSSVFARSVPIKDDVAGIKLADGYSRKIITTCGNNK